MQKMQREDFDFLDDSDGDRLLYDYACALYEDTLLYEAAADYETAAAVG